MPDSGRWAGSSPSWLQVALPGSPQFDHVQRRPYHRSVNEKVTRRQRPNTRRPLDRRIRRGDRPPRHRRPRVRRLLRALVSPSKFAVVGIIGIFVNQVALVLRSWKALGIHYLRRAILASQVSTLNNFLLIEFWVFRGRDARGNILLRYLAFNAINMATLVVRIPVDVRAHRRRRGLLPHLEPGRDRDHLRRPLPRRRQLDLGRAATVATSSRSAAPTSTTSHGLIRIQSPVALPELAAFNVDHRVEPDLIDPSPAGSVAGRGCGSRRSRAADTIRYREQLGRAVGRVRRAAPPLGAEPSSLDANWLLVWSHHVLYTNMVEPLLRFMLVVARLRAAPQRRRRRGAGRRRHVRPDRHRQDEHGPAPADASLWGFLADDMAIVAPGGAIIGFPKPMTLSSHTMSSVNEQALPLADRLMLGIRCRVCTRARAARSGTPSGGCRADRDDQRLGAAAHPAAQVPRDVADRLRHRRPVDDRLRDPHGARASRSPRSRRSTRRSTGCSRTPTTPTPSRRSPRSRRCSSSTASTTTPSGRGSGSCSRARSRRRGGSGSGSWPQLVRPHPDARHRQAAGARARPAGRRPGRARDRRRADQAHARLGGNQRPLRRQPAGSRGRPVGEGPTRPEWRADVVVDEGARPPAAWGAVRRARGPDRRPVRRGLGQRPVAGERRARLPLSAAGDRRARGRAGDRGCCRVWRDGSRCRSRRPPTSAARPTPFRGRSSALRSCRERSRRAAPIAGPRAALGAGLGAFLRTLHEPAIAAEHGERLAFDPMGRADMAIRVPRTRDRLDRRCEAAGLWTAPPEASGC